MAYSVGVARPEGGLIEPGRDKSRPYNAGMA
jgi:hypothetical protein